MRGMNALKRIRKQVFQCTQAEFAEIAGVSQASVSRWENGVAPTLDEMKLIRDAAKKRKIKWDDALFFRATQSSPTGEAAA